MHLKIAGDTYLAGSAEEKAGDGLLDALTSKDLGRDHVKDALLCIGLASKLLELLHLMH